MGRVQQIVYKTLEKLESDVIVFPLKTNKMLFTDRRKIKTELTVVRM